MLTQAGHWPISSTTSPSSYSLVHFSILLKTCLPHPDFPDGPSMDFKQMFIIFSPVCYTVISSHSSSFNPHKDIDTNDRSDMCFSSSASPGRCWGSASVQFYSCDYDCFNDKVSRSNYIASNGRIVTE